MDDLIVRAERRAQEARPARILFVAIIDGTAIDTYAACTLGNLSVTERLREDGGGTVPVQTLRVRVVREDLPSTKKQFRRGERVTVQDLTTGEEFSLSVGVGNETQASVISLTLEKLQA